MSAKHTPGPWHADANGGIWRRRPCELYENGGGVAGDRQLATVWKGWVNDGEIGYPLEANARLIAAAPDLLDACKVAFDQTCAVGRPKDWEQLRAAIAKATGEHHE
jgi:hypothetical protein